MNAKELYLKSRSFIFDNLESKKLDEYYIDFINDLLVELFDENNALRRVAGEDPLVRIPLVKSVDSVIPYEDIMIYSIMPKGLAARFYIDEEDRSKYTILQNEYLQSRSKAMALEFKEYDEAW